VAKARRAAGWSTERQSVVDRLFVYGSLRAGETARSLVTHYIVRSEPAVSQGALYAFADGYPGLLHEGTDRVVGEILWLDKLAEALPLLDAYEGDDFIRVLSPVTAASGEIMWCWAYLLADERFAQEAERIDHGDWVRWRRDNDL
jgi:gamma-glutamylcyclotransferase (GGCT)/AIG2-like uncharacterized protein YtfP